MKRVKEINFKSNDYIFFVDRFDEDKFYCITRNAYNENKSIFEPIKLVHPYDVPDEMTIKAFPLVIFKSINNVDSYDISEPPLEIDFKINRIKWVPKQFSVFFE